MKVGRALIAASGFIPYAAKLLYLRTAWTSSRLDTPDAVFLPLGVALIGWCSWRSRELPVGRCLLAPLLLLLVPFAALFAVGSVWRVNALQVAASVPFAWGAWWLAFGFRRAAAVAAGFAVLLLTTPSVTYWGCHFTGLDAGLLHAVKWGVFALAVLSQFDVTRRILPVPAVLAVGALVFYVCRSVDLMPETPPFVPVFGGRGNGDWVAVEETGNDGFRRFFGTSRARQLLYATPTSQVSVLSVEIGSNVHEVHPASHCLRTSFWVIESETIREIELNGHRVSIAEAVASKTGMGRTLSWTWYSNERLSTGSFFCFRRYANEPGWWTFQVRTPVEQGIESARAVMYDFFSFVLRNAPTAR